MTDPAFNPDDPRLTAFALGELDGADRDEIEQLIAASPEAAAAVRDIEDTVGILNGSLAEEPAPELSEEQRTAIFSGVVVDANSKADSRPSKPIAKIAAASALAGSVEADDLMQAPSVRSFPWAIAGSLVASTVVMIGVVSWMPGTNSPLPEMASTKRHQS